MPDMDLNAAEYKDEFIKTMFQNIIQLLENNYQAPERPETWCAVLTLAYGRAASKIKPTPQRGFGQWVLSGAISKSRGRSKSESSLISQLCSYAKELYGLNGIEEDKRSRDEHLENWTDTQETVVEIPVKEELPDEGDRQYEST